MRGKMIVLKNLRGMFFLTLILTIASSFAMDNDMEDKTANIIRLCRVREKAFSIISQTFDARNFEVKTPDQVFVTLYQGINGALTHQIEFRDHHIFFHHLMEYTFHRLERDTSYYSAGKRWLTGQSNTLLALGVLKNSVTKLGMPMDESLNEKINDKLKDLKFYAGYLDYGAPGFNLVTGEFSNLPDNYSYYPSCITTVNKIYSHPNLIAWRAAEVITRKIGTFFS